MEEDDIEIAHLDDSKQKKEFLEAPSFDEPSELFHNALFCCIRRPILVSQRVKK